MQIDDAVMTDAVAKRGRIYAVLQTLRPDGSGFSTDDGNAITEALIAGFVENREEKKPCRSCGTSLTDYRFFKITPGGRLFMEACAATPVRS